MLLGRHQRTKFVENAQRMLYNVNDYYSIVTKVHTKTAKDEQAYGRKHKKGRLAQ